MTSNLSGKEGGPRGALWILQTRGKMHLENKKHVLGKWETGPISICNYLAPGVKFLISHQLLKIHLHFRESIQHYETTFLLASTVSKKHKLANRKQERELRHLLHCSKFHGYLRWQLTGWKFLLLGWQSFSVWTGSFPSLPPLKHIWKCQCCPPFIG